MNTAKGIVIPSTIMGDLENPPLLLRFKVRPDAGVDEIKDIVFKEAVVLSLLLLAKGSSVEFEAVPYDAVPNKPSPCCLRCMTRNQC